MHRSGIYKKKCPAGAITLVEKVAVIDQEKCNQCRTCIDVCPRNAIMKLRSYYLPDAPTFIGQEILKVSDLVPVPLLHQKELTIVSKSLFNGTLRNQCVEMSCMFFGSENAPQSLCFLLTRTISA
jgi:Fe-S-cluster-containing hydrogenase component 2